MAHSFMEPCQSMSPLAMATRCLSHVHHCCYSSSEAPLAQPPSPCPVVESPPTAFGEAGITPMPLSVTNTQQQQSPLSAMAQCPSITDRGGPLPFELWLVLNGNAGLWDQAAPRACSPSPELQFSDSWVPAAAAGAHAAPLGQSFLPSLSLTSFSCLLNPCCQSETQGVEGEGTSSQHCGWFVGFHTSLS